VFSDRQDVAMRALDTDAELVLSSLKPDADRAAFAKPSKIPRFAVPCRGCRQTRAREESRALPIFSKMLRAVFAKASSPIRAFLEPPPC
jgi:hypothetical protein